MKIEKLKKEDIEREKEKSKIFELTNLIPVCAFFTPFLKKSNQLKFVVCGKFV